MKKTNEEKNIEHFKKTIDEFKSNFEKDFAISEYIVLFEEYKKLVRRYSKTIKQADSMSSKVMKSNESLNDSIQYTINKARAKIMQNIEENRKTKETSSEYLLKLKDFEKLLYESQVREQKLKNKLTFYKKKFGEINDVFDESKIKKEEKIINVNPIELQNINIKQLMVLEVGKSKKNLSLMKLSLNHFSDMIETIEQSSSLENFILGIKRYLINNLNRIYNIKKDYIVFHDKNEIFYLLLRENNKAVLSKFMNDINSKGEVFGFKIVFSMGLTQYQDNTDSIDTFLSRCESAYNQAKRETTPIIK